MGKTLDTSKTKLTSKKYKATGVKVEFKLDTEGHVSVSGAPSID